MRGGGGGEGKKDLIGEVTDQSLKSVGVQQRNGCGLGGFKEFVVALDLTLQAVEIVDHGDGRTGRGCRRQNGPSTQDDEVQVAGDIRDHGAAPTLDQRGQFVPLVTGGAAVAVEVEQAVDDELVGLVGVVHRVGDDIAADDGVALGALQHTGAAEAVLDADDLDHRLAGGVFTGLLVGADLGGIGVDGEGHAEDRLVATADAQDDLVGGAVHGIDAAVDKADLAEGHDAVACLTPCAGELVSQGDVLLGEAVDGGLLSVDADDEVRAGVLQVGRKPVFEGTEPGAVLIEFRHDLVDLPLEGHAPGVEGGLDARHALGLGLGPVVGGGAVGLGDLQPLVELGDLGVAGGDQLEQGLGLRTLDLGQTLAQGAHGKLLVTGHGPEQLRTGLHQVLHHRTALPAGGVQHRTDRGVLTLRVGDEVGIVLTDLGQIIPGALRIAVEHHRGHEQGHREQPEDGDGDGDADAGSGAGCHIESRSKKKVRREGQGGEEEGMRRGSETRRASLFG